MTQSYAACFVGLTGWPPIEHWPDARRANDCHFTSAARKSRADEPIGRAQLPAPVEGTGRICLHATRHRPERASLPTPRFAGKSLVTFTRKDSSIRIAPLLVNSITAAKVCTAKLNHLRSSAHTRRKTHVQSQSSGIVR